MQNYLMCEGDHYAQENSYSPIKKSSRSFNFNRDFCQTARAINKTHFQDYQSLPYFNTQDITKQLHQDDTKKRIRKSEYQPRQDNHWHNTTRKLDHTNTVKYSYGNKNDMASTWNNFQNINHNYQLEGSSSQRYLRQTTGNFKKISHDLRQSTKLNYKNQFEDQFKYNLKYNPPNQFQRISKVKSFKDKQNQPNLNWNPNNTSNHDSNRNNYMAAIKSVEKKSAQLTNSSIKDSKQDIVNLTNSVRRQTNKKKQQIEMEQKKIPCLKDFLVGEAKGEGRFGKVFLAVHKKTGFVCAIKKIKKETLTYIVDQFINEVKIQMFLNNPSIVRLYGVFYDVEHIYLIMEYMEEGSLYTYIKNQQNKCLSEKQASKKISQVAKGLKYLHEQSIVHRDIKPENIVLTNSFCKICDFGWSAYCKGRRSTYCGTLDYVPPEILQGQQYDGSVDIWCLGVMAYQIMAGKTPFYNISRKQTMRKILQGQMSFPKQMSASAKKFVQKILKRNPDDRMNINLVLEDEFITMYQDQ